MTENNTGMNREQIFASLLVLVTEANAKSILAVTLAQTQGLKAGAENLILTVGDNLSLQFMLLGALGFKSSDIKELVAKQTEELKGTYKDLFNTTTTPPQG